MNWSQKWFRQTASVQRIPSPDKVLEIKKDSMTSYRTLNSQISELNPAKLLKLRWN
jgi:hypothetical protein